MNRYLTKSRFKLGMDCPSKLYFTGKKEYADNSVTDEFMKALAEGGFQVGELAKCYYPGGIDIKSKDYEEALEQTNELLKRDKVIIFEAAVLFENLFIRVDILEKDGDHIKIKEVKSKSFHTEEEFLTKKNPDITAGWKAYLYDIAFPHYVATLAFPGKTISSYLVLIDKKAATTVDQLHQKFLVVRNGHQSEVMVDREIPLGDKILAEINIQQYADLIFSGTETLEGKTYTYPEYVNALSHTYKEDIFLQEGIGKKCKTCQFKATAEQEAEGLKSGFKKCWAVSANFKAEDFQRESVMDLWNYRKADEDISQGIYFLEQVNVMVKPHDNPGLSTAKRQALQVQFAKREGGEYYFDKEGFMAATRQLKYPLNFIDFETITPAIPFHQGMRPYETIAFQFSHHTLDEKGNVSHQAEWINREVGAFPNFTFVRHLKAALSQNEGLFSGMRPMKTPFLIKFTTSSWPVRNPIKKSFAIGSGPLPNLRVRHR